MQREFEDYLKCDRLEHGFLRVRCETCREDRVGLNYQNGSFTKKKFNSAYYFSEPDIFDVPKCLSYYRDVQPGRIARIVLHLVGHLYDHLVDDLFGSVFSRKKETESHRKTLFHGGYPDPTWITSAYTSPIFTCFLF